MKSLADVLREAKGSLGLRRSLEIVRELCLAVEMAEGKTPVRRSVSLDRIFLSIGPDGGEFASFDATESVGGDAFGVYDLGAILYLMLTGESVSSDDPVMPVDALAPGMPETVAALTMKALAADPANRFTTVREMRLAIEIEISRLVDQPKEKAAAPVRRGASTEGAVVGQELISPSSATADPPRDAARLDRSLDLALSASVPVLTPVELLALLRRPESKSLAALLSGDPDTDLKPENVRTRGFGMEFPRNPDGSLQPVAVVMRVTAPDFEPSEVERTVWVHPELDCERQSFLLTPQKTGNLQIQFEVLIGQATVASRNLKTFSEPSERLKQATAPVAISVPLSIVVKRDPWLVNRRRAIAATVALICSAGAAYYWKDVILPKSGTGFRDDPVVPGPASAQTPVPTDRKDFALLFATNDYNNFTRLENPIYDASAIATELKGHYGFEVELLAKPKDTTREAILKKIIEYKQKQYATGSQLLIFFSGHGSYDPNLSDGFIVASDAKATSTDPTRGTFVSFAQLQQAIDGFPCNHILVILDVCYGGAFDKRTATSGRDIEDYNAAEAQAYIAEKTKIKTRWYLTSGGMVRVPDGDAGRHSPFTWWLLDAFGKVSTKGKLLRLPDLISSVNNVKTPPRYGPFGDNDPGSDFFFLRQ